eukprot:4839498-Amphidinium_carterae.1
MEILKLSDPNGACERATKRISKKTWFSEGVRVLKLRVFPSSSHCVGKVEETSVLLLHLLSVFH